MAMREGWRVIDGGLAPRESIIDKLRSRPEDFPEEVFRRVLREHEDRLPVLDVVAILRRRSEWSPLALEIVDAIRQ